MYIDYKAPNGTMRKKAAGIVQTLFFWPPTLSAAEFPSGSDRLYSLQPACTTQPHPQPKHFNVHLDQIPLAQMTQAVHFSETSVLKQNTTLSKPADYNLNYETCWQKQPIYT
jgi:hypothetical protein